MTHIAKHTPGPWRIIDSRNQSKATIVGADFPAMGFVADVNLCRNNTHQQVDGHANAALIAAAPAMYEALQQTLFLVELAALEEWGREVTGEHQPPTTEARDRLEKVKAALAQAEDKP